jgi:protoheme IX farnesyltransferase
MIKAYYQLAKPGIIYGNALTAIAGFALAAHGHASFITFASMLLGICLVMASGCVFNNYLERDIDAKMARTKKRPSVTGVISPLAMLVYGTVLGILGMLCLAGT